MHTKLLPYIVPLYSTYVCNYDPASLMYQKLSAQFGSKKSDLFKTSVQDMPLVSLLIMPVSRIPRYSLLFSDLSKHIEAMYCAIDDAATTLQQQQQLNQQDEQDLNKLEQQLEECDSVCDECETVLIELRRIACMVNQEVRINEFENAEKAKAAAVSGKTGRNKNDAQQQQQAIAKQYPSHILGFHLQAIEQYKHTMQ